MSTWKTAVLVSYVCVCDNCSCGSLSYSKRKAAIQWARLDGWRRFNGQILCPKCLENKQGEKKVGK